MFSLSNLTLKLVTFVLNFNKKLFTNKKIIKRMDIFVKWVWTLEGGWAKVELTHMGDGSMYLKDVFGS